MAAEKAILCVLLEEFLYIYIYQPGHKGALFAFKTEHISTKNPCVEADTEERTHFASQG